MKQTITLTKSDLTRLVEMAHKNYTDNSFIFTDSPNLNTAQAYLEAVVDILNEVSQTKLEICLITTLNCEVIE